MFEIFVKPKHNDLDENGEVWFQQDGSTTHTAKRSIVSLGEMLSSRLTSFLADVKWSTCSPDDQFF